MIRYLLKIAIGLAFETSGTIEGRPESRNATPGFQQGRCRTCEHFQRQGTTGRTIDRPALRRCLKKLDTGDTLIVWKLDRLSRSARDFVIMADGRKERGVH